VRTEVAPLSGRQLAPVPEWTRQVHDRLLGTHLDRLALAHTDRTLDPDRSVDTAPITASTTSSTAARHHPRPRPPAMPVPPVPRRRLVLVPRRSPTVVPDHQTQRAHPCRCPCGAPCPPSPERHAVGFTITPLAGAARGWPRSSTPMSRRWHSDHCSRRCGESHLRPRSKPQIAA
jgi:hypothetical protein